MNPIALTLLLLSGLIAVLLDLGVFNRKRRVMTLSAALAWSGFWLAVALVFTGLVYLIYEGEFQEAGGLAGTGPTGQQAALQFFSGFVIEKSIALANVLALAMIFAHLAIPLGRQPRVLLIVFALIVALRVLTLAAGWEVFQRFAWANDVLGVLLVASAARVFVTSPERIAPRRNLAVFLLERRFPPPAQEPDGEMEPGEVFFILHDGARRATRLSVALILAATVSAMFAVDAVPGIFSVTRDPWIVVTANLFALLGLRAMYFVFVGFISRLRYLKISLAVLLAYVGIRLVLADRQPIPELPSLAAMGAILAAGLVLSMILGPREAPGLSPMLRGLEDLVWISYRQGRRLVVFVVGVTVMLVGVVMIVTPGPAFVMIPLGLAILTIEFAWARRWMGRLQRGARQVEGRIRERLPSGRPDDEPPTKRPGADGQREDR